MQINKLEEQLYFHTEQVKQLKYLVFAKGDKAKEAEEAGADFVGAEELVQKSKEKIGLTMM